jgi:uncharacterized repeat protein (TIGR01451 family)
MKQAPTWITVLVLGLVVAAAPALAGSLAVSDNQHQVSAGELRLGGTSPDCCDTAPCGGRFILENTGSNLGRVSFEVSPLWSGSSEIPAGHLRFAPSMLTRLPAGASETISLELLGAEQFQPGHYRGLVYVLAERLKPHEGEHERLKLPVSVQICDEPAVASLRLVPDLGDYSQGLLSFAPGPEGCAGADFSARFTVEADGGQVLGAVTPFLSDLPSDVAVAFEPESVALKPGEQAEFLASLLVADTVPVGTHVGALMLLDAASGAADSGLARFDRCEASTPEEEPEENPEEADEPDLDAGTGEEPGPHFDGPTRLELAFESSKSAVRYGEVLTYSCLIRNAGTSTAGELELTVVLPAGFRYVRERTALDGAVGPEPLGNRPYRWRIPGLTPGDETLLAFQSVVTGSARLGQAVARAQVRSGQAQAGPVEINVAVTRNWRGSFGLVEGRVAYPDGRGVAGVRLFLDSNRETLSGPDGRFGFDSVVEGEHLVSLDARSLTPGERLSSEDSMFVYLFSSASEYVHFVVLGRPLLTLSLGRVSTAPESGSDAD